MGLTDHTADIIAGVAMLVVALSTFVTGLAFDWPIKHLQWLASISALISAAALLVQG